MSVGGAAILTDVMIWIWWCAPPFLRELPYGCGTSHHCFTVVMKYSKIQSLRASASNATSAAVYFKGLCRGYG